MIQYSTSISNDMSTFWYIEPFLIPYNIAFSHVGQQVTLCDPIWQVCTTALKSVH